MNNEERILEMLGALTEKVDKQGEQLAKLDVRMDGIDTRLDQMDTRLDELDSRSLRSAVLLETEVTKKIQLVYEGQELLRQKMEELVPKDRVEVLEDEVITLKTAMKSLSKRLAALEKAQ